MARRGRSVGDPRVAAAEALKLVRRAIYTISRNRRVLQALARKVRDGNLERVAEAYKRFELSLEAVALRLETILVLGFATQSMVEPLRRGLRALAEARGLPPDAAEAVVEVDEALSRLQASLPAPAPESGMPDIQTGPTEDAGMVLKEAEAVARARASGVLGSLGS